MYCFKISGERNSGTQFMHQLIKTNFGNTFEEGSIKFDSKDYIWKHGDPNNNMQENKTFIKIFVVRKLESWLVSMFHNHYHLNNFNNFKKFLTTPFKEDDVEKRKEFCIYGNIPVNFEDIDKTIFQVRYYKYLKIKEYCEQNENIILVSLEYLQNDDNCIHFLKEINHKYNFNKKEDNFKLIEKHTKNGNMNLKNRTYKINHEDYQLEIDNNKNIEIENEINNLTYFIK